MQEKLYLKLNNLDDYEETSLQILSMFEQLFKFYTKKDIKTLEKIVSAFFVYFYYLSCELLQEGEDSNDLQ